MASIPVKMQICSTSVAYLELCPSIGYVQYGVDSACETALVSLYCGDTLQSPRFTAVDREGWLRCI